MTLQQYKAQREVLVSALGWARRLFNVGWLCDGVGRQHASTFERQWFCALLRLRAQQGEAVR